MINLLENPQGLDKTIQDVQERLYEELSYIWRGDIEGYGRVEKTPINTGDEVPDYYRTAKLIIPEWYNANTKDYEEVYYNDSKSCVFCFLISDTDSTKDGDVYTNKVKVVFMLDLKKIYGMDLGRVVSRAQKEAVRILKSISYGIFEITGLERRVDIIFQQYKTNNIQEIDMHPLHIFAVNVDLNYVLEDNC